MSRSNSIAIYHQIQEDGLLSKMRWKVYEKLFHYGPATASELAQRFPPSVGGRGEAGNVHARLIELTDRGVVRVLADRVCTVTSRIVSEYDVTSNLPKEPTPKPEQLGAKALAFLQRLCDSLDDRPTDQAAVRRTIELVKPAPRRFWFAPPSEAREDREQ